METIQKKTHTHTHTQKKKKTWGVIFTRKRSHIMKFSKFFSASKMLNSTFLERSNFGVSRYLLLATRRQTCFFRHTSPCTWRNDYSRSFHGFFAGSPDDVGRGLGFFLFGIESCEKRNPFKWVFPRLRENPPHHC